MGSYSTKSLLASSSGCHGLPSACACCQTPDWNRLLEARDGAELAAGDKEETEEIRSQKQQDLIRVFDFIDFNRSMRSCCT